MFPHANLLTPLTQAMTPRGAVTPRGQSSLFRAACCLFLLGSCGGCTTLLNPISGIPVTQLPPELLGERRAEYVEVPVALLSIPAGQPYRLDAGDILGVYIEGVLPFSSPTAVPGPPPVNFPAAGSTLPPSIGFPIAVQEGGLLNLPLLEPFSVRGMTVEEARQRIAAAYREREILDFGDTVPVVTLIRERNYNVTVIRTNGGPPGTTTGIAAGYDLQLPAYRNDVLHALTQSGGLPGFHEKNAVTVFKASRLPRERRSELLMRLASASNSCQACVANQIPAAATWVDRPAGSGWPNGNLLDLGDEGLGYGFEMIQDPLIVKIPLRVPPGSVPLIEPEDIELVDGDIVYVESRETEFFYTGGLLSGGQIPLPRDYDLDVLGALALAGSGVASERGGGGGGMGGGLIQGIGGASPTQLYVIRKMACGRTFNISVDLQQALNDSHQNILVQPGDTLVLRFKPHEEVANFALGTFFTLGIRELFRNR